MKNLYIVLIDKTLPAEHPYQCWFVKSSIYNNQMSKVLAFAKNRNIRTEDVILQICESKTEWTRLHECLKANWDMSLAENYLNY